MNIDFITQKLAEWEGSDDPGKPDELTLQMLLGGQDDITQIYVHFGKLYMLYFSRLGPYTFVTFTPSTITV